jgi:hypothetical protein
MSENNLYCMRCELDKKNKKTTIFHNIMCSKATKEEINQCGQEHMNRFSAIWVAVQSWLIEKEFTPEKEE